MPARAAWKGFLCVHQLSVPVKAFTAVISGPEISLNQLHRHCGKRIRQQKVCPEHGLVGSEEIVSGFAIAQDQYLPLEPAELEALHPEDHKAIAVECFVPQTRIDPVYHSGRTYYLVPDGPPGQRPFGVLRDGMRQSDRHAVALVVIGHSEYLVVLRPLAKVLAMTVLEYPQRIRPSTDYETEVATITSNDTEQRLIRQLIDSLTDPELDLDRYRDKYTDRLSQLIQERQALFETPIVSISPEGNEESDLVSALVASLATVNDGHRQVGMRPSVVNVPSEAGANPDRIRKLG